MQILVIIALISLAPSLAAAQNLPGAPDNVEINLDALAPMDQEYDPPKMFDAPLTGMEIKDPTDPQPQNTMERKDSTAHSPARTPAYFDPPPIPPKRPVTFSASKDFLQNLNHKKTNKEPQKIKETSDLTSAPSTYNQDLQGDMVEMNAKNVLESLGGNDITETPKALAQEKTKPEIPADKEPQISAGNNMLSIPFEIGSTVLDESSQALLRNGIIPILKRSTNTGLEIRSYASPHIEEENARRTSLTRALKVREFLAESGINKDRISIRALGDQTDQEPRDRADIVLLP